LIGPLAPAVFWRGSWRVHEAILIARDVTNGEYEALLGTSLAASWTYHNMGYGKASDGLAEQR